MTNTTTPIIGVRILDRISPKFQAKFTWIGEFRFADANIEPISFEIWFFVGCSSTLRAPVRVCCVSSRLSTLILCLATFLVIFLSNL